jgi:hypothetical protein
LAVITLLLPKNLGSICRAAKYVNGRAALQIKFGRAANQILLPVFSAASAPAANTQRVSTFTLNGIVQRGNFLHLLV